MNSKKLAGSRRFGTLVALALLVSCRSSDGDEGGAGNAAAICAEAAPAYCQQLFSCSPEDARQFYSSVQSCQTEEAATCRLYGGLAGVSPMTSTLLGECNRAHATQSCEEFIKGPSPEACRLLPGTRANGEACVNWLQCASKNCRTPGSTDPEPPPDLDPWCGTCAPESVAGDPCAEWYGCDGPGLVCEKDRCVQREALGGPCQTSRACQGDLVCLEGKCGPGRGDGEPCTDGLECASALRCVSGKCATGLPAGATCQAYYECQSTDCDLTTHRCLAESKVVGVGEPCGRDTCSYDSRCDEISKKCVALKRQGEPCARNFDCAYLFACRAGKCQPISDDMCKK